MKAMKLFEWMARVPKAVWWGPGVSHPPVIPPQSCQPQSLPVLGKRAPFCTLR